MAAPSAPLRWLFNRLDWTAARLCCEEQRRSAEGVPAHTRLSRCVALQYAGLVDEYRRFGPALARNVRRHTVAEPTLFHQTIARIPRGATMNLADSAHCRANR
jgi:hypothetical protein